MVHLSRPSRTDPYTEISVSNNHAGLTTLRLSGSTGRPELVLELTAQERADLAAALVGHEVVASVADIQAEALQLLGAQGMPCPTKGD